MQEKIHTLFAPLMAQLPQILGEDELVFDENNLPIFEETAFDTTQIAINKGWHSYNDCYKIEHFHVSTTPEYYQIWGLTMLCAVLQNKEITLHLTNPHSFIKKIILRYDYKKLVGLSEKPMRFHHYANEIRSKNPYYGLDSSYFPSVFLMSEKEFCNDEADWAQRNILELGQSSKAMANLAEVFLDFGNPNNKQPELVFEGHAGYCNLQPMSCEITFWLPNSLGWFDEAFASN
jgi:hypothetical protein